MKIGRRWDRQSRTQVPADARPAAGAGAARPLPIADPGAFASNSFSMHGIGIATFNKDDLAPDFVDSEALGVKALYLKPGQTKPADDEWGAIAVLGVGRQPRPRLL